jgi:hypothetical protein
MWPHSLVNYSINSSHARMPQTLDLSWLLQCLLSSLKPWPLVLVSVVRGNKLELSTVYTPRRYLYSSIASALYLLQTNNGMSKSMSLCNRPTSETFVWTLSHSNADKVNHVLLLTLWMMIGALFRVNVDLIAWGLTTSSGIVVLISRVLRHGNRGNSWSSHSRDGTELACQRCVLSTVYETKQTSGQQLHWG